MDPFDVIRLVSSLALVGSVGPFECDWSSIAADCCYRASCNSAGIQSIAVVFAKTTIVEIHMVVDCCKATCMAHRAWSDGFS